MWGSTREWPLNWAKLLVQRLGVGGSGSDVSVTGGLVGAGGQLQSEDERYYAPAWLLAT